MLETTGWFQLIVLQGLKERQSNSAWRTALISQVNLDDGPDQVSHDEQRAKITDLVVSETVINTLMLCILQYERKVDRKQ